MARDNVLKVTIFADDETKKGFQSVTTGVAVMSTAIVASLGAATKAASDFEKGLAEVQTLLGTQAGGAVQGFSRELRDLSVTSGQTLGSLTKARYDIISAGFTDAAESAKLLETSLDVARGGLVDVATAADLMTTTLNGLGLTAEESTRAADVLFTTVRLGKTTMTELADSLGPVFATARVARVSLEEVGAAMATITAAGIETREASTALNNLLRALAAPSKEAGRELAKLGITLDKGLGPALEALGKQGAEGLDALSKLIPNIRALKAAASAGADIDSFNASLAEMHDSFGAISDAASIMEDTLATQMEILRAQVSVLAVEVGDALLPVMRGLVGVAQEGVDALRGFRETVGDTGIVIAGAVGVVGLLASALGGLALAVVPALPALTALVASVGAPALLAAGGVFAAITAALSALGIQAQQSARKMEGLGRESTEFGSTETVEGIRSVGFGLAQVKTEAEEVAKFIKDANDNLTAFGESQVAGLSLNARPSQQKVVDDGTVEEVAEVAQEVDKLAAAIEAATRRAGNAQTQFASLFGETPDELTVMLDGLDEVGADFVYIQKVIDEMTNQEFEAWIEKAKELKEVLPDNFMGELELPPPPRELEAWRVELHGIVDDLEYAAEFAVDSFAVGFGDAVASAIVDAKSFGEAFTESFTSLKRAVIGLIAEMLVLRAVTRGLKALSGVGGPLGAIAGFLLPGSNAGTSFAHPRKLNTGIGFVPGEPGADSFPTFLSGGEAVLTRRQNSLLRRGLGMMERGRSSMLDSLRNAGQQREPLVVGLSSGLLRTEAVELSDRRERIERRRGGTT